MQIKWIELNGFKSFPERTKIELNEGITCFVGPNGAGKSNIVDAFRWIFGEHNPRILRGEKMEEIIFQGAVSKKEKGLAEVSILLIIKEDAQNGNEPQSREVEIKRRFYRTGESYFIINGKQSRLKDIKEIFISEGVDVRTYSVIEQVKINEVLTKSSYRKTLLEECSGISLYKMKKTESDGKLQSAKENLQRIEDILGELKKQYSLLERQAKRAEKHKKIIDELSILELKISKAESLSLLDELKNLKEEIQSLEMNYRKLREENILITTKIGKQKNKISHIENIIQQRENQIKQAEFEKTKIEKELALIIQEEKNKSNEIGKLSEEISILSKEIEKSQSELKGAQYQAQEIEERMSNIQREIIIFEENLLKFQHQFVELEKDIEIKRKSLFNLTTELANKKNIYHSVKKTIEHFQNRLNTIIYEKQEFTKKIKELETELKEKEAKIKNLEESLQVENTNLNELIDELSLLERNFDEKNQTLIEKKKEETIISGKIEALSSEIWEEERNHKLFFECIEITPEAEELIEIFFDEKLKASVIENIEQIRSSNNKRFFFLKDLSKTENNLSPVSELRRIEEFIKIKDEGISNKVFENIFIVETIKEAIEKRQNFPYSYFITKKGEVVFPDGFIKTGKTEDLLKKKKLLRELNYEKEQVMKEIEALEKKIIEIKTKKENLKVNTESKKAYIASVKGEIFRLEERYKNLQIEVEGISQRVKYMDNEEKALYKDIAENTKLIETVRSKIDHISVSIDDTEAKIEELKKQEREIFRENEGKKDILSTIKIEFSTLKERLNNKKVEINRLDENIKKLFKRKNSNEEEIKQSLERIEQIRCKYAEKIKKVEMLYRECENLKEELENLLKHLQQEKEDLDKLEEKYQIITEELHNVTTIIGERKAKEAELKIKLENLWHEIYNIYGKDIFQEQIELFQDNYWAKGRIGELKAQLKDTGPVDIEILKEYQEVKERYDFMLSQQKDIKISIEELEEAIRKINALTRKKLRETFYLLRDRFNSVFQELFGGGKAEIVLNNENNILDSELEINVQPPGKKMSNLNLLSGGEKTLTALAFIFACLYIRPSPICILDEVDATLDDPNTLRFRKLIKNLSNKTQFLIITHNKLMMECANYIYGVTMQEEGISTVICIEFKDAAEVYA